MSGQAQSSDGVGAQASENVSNQIQQCLDNLGLLKKLKHMPVITQMNNLEDFIHIRFIIYAVDIYVILCISCQYQHNMLQCMS